MSALVLAPQNEHDFGLLEAREVYRMRLQARLAVLSACGTTKGHTTGEGIIGLAWAFLVAGCPSTLATRWQLEDESTPLWVKTFSQHYMGGKSKAESLRQVYLGLIRMKSQKKEFSSPSYWGVWTLIGDGR